VAIAVLVILVGAVLIGRFVLELFGISFAPSASAAVWW
jgi:hypothetical protein